MKKILPLLLAVGILSVAHCQYPYIPEHYRYYYPDLDIPDPIGNWDTCLPFINPAVMEQEYACDRYYHERLEDYTASYVSSLNFQCMAIGFVAERRMDIVGLSFCYDRRVPNIHSFYSICNYILQLHQPAGSGLYFVDQVEMGDPDTATANYQIAIDPLLFSMIGVNLQGPEEVFHRYLHQKITIDSGEMFFIRPLVVAKETKDTIEGMFDVSEMHLWELPYISVHHWDSVLYRARINGEWETGAFYSYPLIWAIVRYEEDTCSAPQAVRVERTGLNAVSLSWDPGANDTLWQVSYGLAGTPPDGGSISNCHSPQWWVEGLDTTSHYVAYVRSRCEFERTEWSDWSLPVDIFLDSQPITTAIDNVNRTAPLLLPNPASESVTLQLPDGELPARVDVYSAAGNLMLSSTDTHIDVSQLPQGVYLLHATSASTTYQCRLVVSR